MQDVVKTFNRGSFTQKDRIAAMMSEVTNMVRAKMRVDNSRSGASSPKPVFWTTGLQLEPHLHPMPAIGMGFSGGYAEVLLSVV